MIPAHLSLLRHATPSLSKTTTPRWWLGVLLLLACCSPGWAAAPQFTPTLSLTVSANGAPVTTVAAGTVVTLTATLAGGAPGGQVTFCDASSPHCTDIHLLATGQVTSANTATFKFIPGIGTHAYRAVYLGTGSNAQTVSSVSVLTVTGTYPTATTIQQSGTAGNYTLTATVVGTGSETLALPGSVFFLDTSNSNESLGAASLGASTAGFGFLTSAAPAAGTSPCSVAVGDFNGDGIPDLAVADHSVDGPVTVLLGKGDGTFPQATSTLVGSYPCSVAVGDFNGDGIPDLAVANYYDETVTVLLGIGNGTFTQRSTPEVGGIPTSVAVGDFNGDGIPDLAVASFAGNNVTVLLGNGDGNFALKSTPEVGTNPTSVAVGDFNGDGIPDLAVVNSLDSTVTVLLGNGEGDFTTESTPTVGPLPNSVAVGDFNGDGIPDLAVASQHVSAATVLLGNGDGNFTQQSTPTVGFEPTSVAVADFNGDGIPDLAVVAALSDNATILLTQLTQTATASVIGISPVGVGLHAVDASYPANTNYSGSASSTVSLTAAQVTTRLLLIATPTSGSTYGQPVTLTANLSPSAAQGDTTDGEQVKFYSGSTLLGTGFLSAGQASVNVTSLPVGSYSFAARYAGDTNFTGSHASPFSYAVTGATPTISFSVPNQTYGAAPFTVAATSNSTGAITYSVLSGPAKISGNMVTLTGAGTVVLQASQAAAGNYTAGSQNASFIVTAPATPVTLQFAATTLTYPLLPAFEVTLALQGKVAPTGSVTIFDGSTAVGKYPVLTFAAGHVIGLLPPLNVGQHAITAVYSGDQNYPSGTSAPVTVTVTPGPVVLQANCGNLTLQAGQSLSCQILALEAFLPVDGTVNYALNGGPQTAVSLNNGRAAITLSNPPVGNNALLFTYAAQGNYQAAPPVTVKFSVASP